MAKRVFVYDSTASDHLSKVRGVGRYLQVLREALPDATFSSDLSKASSYDILINPFVNFLLPPVINKRFVEKQIAVIHDLIPLKYPKHFPAGIRGRINIFTNKQSLKHYDVVITDSEASKKDLMSILKIPHEKIEIIYPALSKLFLNAKHEARNKPHFAKASRGKQTINYKLPTNNYCLYVGDATWNKNLVTMAQAVLLADVQCVVVGSVFNVAGGRAKGSQSRGGAEHDWEEGGQALQQVQLDHSWQQELKTFLKITKSDPHFIFPGYVSDEELISLYQKASCNLLVSRSEGFGYSYFEAASQGVPSVLSDIPVFRETAGDAAVFVDHTDEESIADGIRTVTTNTDTREKISKKLKSQVKKVMPESFQKNLVRLL